MSESAPLPPKDFFLNVGSRDGIREGDLLEVSRSFPVIDRAGMPGQLMRVRLGELRVVTASDSTCLARAWKEREPTSLPAMDAMSFAIGDEVEPADRAPEKTDLRSN